MTEEQSTNPQPSVCMPEDQLQSKVFRKMIIMRINPVLSVQGVKRKLDCLSGNLEEVEKPSKTTLMPYLSLPAPLVSETRQKTCTFRYITGSKPVICHLPRCTVLQNRHPATVVTLLPGPGRVNLLNKKSQLIKTVKEVVGSKTSSKEEVVVSETLSKEEAVVSKTSPKEEAVVSRTLSREAQTLSKQFFIGGDRYPGNAKPVRKTILVFRDKKVDRIGSDDLLKPVESTRGQLINGPHIQASNRFPAPHTFPLDDLSKNDLSFSQMAQNADSALKPVESTRGQLINGPHIQASNSFPAPHTFPLDNLSKNDLSISQLAQNADSALTSAVPIACEASAACQVPPRPSESITDFSDVGDHDMIPQIQCPVHLGECEFRTLNIGHLTDHVNWHMAAVPCRWCVLCHKCSAMFDNFLDVMSHRLQNKCPVKVITICIGPANKVGRHESVKDSFSSPSIEKVAVNTVTCHSVLSDFLAQKYVDRFRSPEVDSNRKPVSCHSVVSIEQMGLFLAVQSSVNANEFNVSSKWSVIRSGDSFSLAQFQWQRPFPQIQLKKSATLSSSPAFETSSVSSKTAVVADGQEALQNVTETDQVIAECSETSSKSQTVTVPLHLFNQLVETNSASSNIEEVKSLVNVNNDVQPLNVNNDVQPLNVNNDVQPLNVNNDVQPLNVNNDVQPQLLPSVAQSDKTVAVKFKCRSKQKTKKSLFLKKKTTRGEPLQSEAVPIAGMSKNLNRSAYAEIKTLFIGQQNGINENFKVIIKEIESKLQYQCPYCIYSSQSIFSVAKHLVQDQDKADLELSNSTNSSQLTTHTLLMHCRLCDYVTHHHSSLLWHLQNIHDILDEPLTLNDNPVNTSEAAALHSRRTLHFRCMRFDECAFANTSVSAVAQHSYQAHAGDGNMFGIGHVMCNKVSFGVCHDSSEMRITLQFVCAHCHVVTLSWKLFALHYLYKHGSRLLYICMYCEMHLSSLTAIIKHITDSHAKFERMICSVMFTGDLGEVETVTINSEQCPDVFVDTAAPFSRIARPAHHSWASVLSVPCTDVKIASSN